MSLGEIGSGVGHSGGGGGAIRSAGGAFGKLEAAHEEKYFHELQQTQLKILRDQWIQQMEHHKRMIKTHESAADLSRRRIAELQEELHSYNLNA